eukprot:scaffold18372_cov118-Isochrysis_galbana.AAC.4
MPWRRCGNVGAGAHAHARATCSVQHGHGNARRPYGTAIELRALSANGYITRSRHTQRPMWNLRAQVHFKCEFAPSACAAP